MTLDKLYPLSKCSSKYILKVILVIILLSANFWIISEFLLVLEMFNLWLEDQRLYNSQVYGISILKLDPLIKQ